MVTYDFYENTYLGNKIDGAEFPELAARAEEFVALLERQYQAKAALPQGRELAICAVVDRLDSLQQGGQISAASVGEVSVHYALAQSSPWQNLYRVTMPYLDICRGVI